MRRKVGIRLALSMLTLSVLGSAPWTQGLASETLRAGSPPVAERDLSAVWFDDLAGVEPLAEADQQALARLLSALAFGSGKGSVELSPGLAADREPRIALLSLNDGAAPARVLKAAGYGAGLVVDRLQRQLERLSGVEVRAVRVDLVTEVRLERVDPERPLELPRSLYGLAFERGSGLVFLPEDVVVHTLINSDQELRLRNVEKRLTSRSERAELEDLTAADLAVYRFATASSFSVAGAEPQPLYRGHRLFAPASPEQLLEHAVLAGRYLARSVGEDGRFVYSYLAKTGEVKDDYNALRHCGTVYSMLELYQVTGERELLAAAERALGHLEREFVKRCEVGEVETACIVDKGAVKLGGNGLAMVALAKHVEVTGEDRYRELIDDLGRWILLTQGADGEFKIHKQIHGGEVDAFISGYYPGEALLALVRRPAPDEAWLDAAERGARWLIEVRDRDLPLRSLNHDHWLLYALNELHRLRPDPLYLKHASRITRAILEAQRRRDPEFPDWLGSYYTPPRSTPTATRSEGLGAAYWMMRDAGRVEQAAALRDALELGVRFQLQTQFLPENVFYVAEPARALGGFHRSLTNYEIRIDYVQHNLSALLLLRRILLAEPPGGAGI